MPDWQERITQETSPALRAEHDLRYALAAPLVAGAAVWADLGSGNGVAAADALGTTFGGRAILVDVDEQASQNAAREVTAAETVPMTADLSSAEDVARVRAAILETPGERVVTCFECIEHLRSFVPLVDMLRELADAGEATVLLSVPNDAFWSIENPYHETMWGEGAFDELRRQLPDGAVLVRQVALQGSAIVPLDAPGPHTTSVDVTVDATDAVPTHFVAAFGPRAGGLDVHAAVGQTDLTEQRAWERQREADLVHLQALQAQLDRWRDELQQHHTWFEEWRAYINDLEGRLGMPPSGASKDELPERATTAEPAE